LSERAGAEAGDSAAGLERLARGLAAVENLKPVAERVVKNDQILDVTLVGKGAGALCDLDAVLFEMGRDRVKRRGIGHFPAEEADAFAAVGIDDNALLAIVHAERQRRARFVDGLQPKQAGAVARPIAQVLGANTDISQSLRNHC
jgi:hypothetical protein